MTTYILTLVSRAAIKPTLEAITRELATYKLAVINTRHLNPAFGAEAEAYADAYRFELDGELNPEALKALSQHLSNTFLLDASIQTALNANTAKKLVCFDMDSTLIQHEVMDELAYRYGIGEKIAAITETAMRGEISFQQSFEQRLACLKGFDAALIPDIAQNLKLTPGAKTLIKTLRAHGIKIAILSGGFENFAVHLQKELGEMDAIYANILEIVNGKLNGKISNELVSETRKLTLIKSLTDQYGLRSAETIAVGDGANDIPMLLHAGLGVAYRAKPIVQEKAPHCINHNDLSAILYLLGYTRAQFTLQ